MGKIDNENPEIFETMNIMSEDEIKSRRDQENDEYAVDPIDKYEGKNQKTFWLTKF